MMNDKKVLVSGVFDLLHKGHFQFLKNAKNLVGKLGKLVVVVHGDESVRAKKGPNRPINPIEKRMKNLSKLDCVDEVVRWDGWENVTEIIKKINPAIIAITKGDPATDIKQKFAKENGIELVEVTDRLKNYSTTKIIEKKYGSKNR